MKHLSVRKFVSIYDLTKLEPIYKANYIGDGKYKAEKVGQEKVALVERGNLGESFFLGRKTKAKPMWAIQRVRRAKAGQLRLF